MNKQLLTGGIAAIIIALVAVIIYALSGLSQPVITDYASCVKAGYASELTYPAQCVTKDGRTYIQAAAIEAATSAVPAY